MWRRLNGMRFNRSLRKKITEVASLCAQDPMRGEKQRYRTVASLVLRKYYLNSRINWIVEMWIWKFILWVFCSMAVAVGESKS